MASTKKPVRKTVSTAAKPALKTAKKVTPKPKSVQSGQHTDMVKIEVVAFTILSAIFLVLAIVKYT